MSSPVTHEARTNYAMMHTKRDANQTAYDLKQTVRDFKQTAIDVTKLTKSELTSLGNEFYEKANAILESPPLSSITTFLSNYPEFTAIPLTLSADSFDVKFKRGTGALALGAAAAIWLAHFKSNIDKSKVLSEDTREWIHRIKTLESSPYLVAKARRAAESLAVFHRSNDFPCKANACVSFINGAANIAAAAKAMYQKEFDFMDQLLLLSLISVVGKAMLLNFSESRHVSTSRLNRAFKEIGAALMS